MHIDINCDMGESFGAFQAGNDMEVLPSITSLNIACGFHAGDPRVMERSVREAARRGLGIGAHPSFPDLVGFGRRDMGLSPEEVRTDVLYQVGALFAFARAAGIPLQHVKPHGQLHNLAVIDRAMADAIVSAVREFDPSLIVIAYGGELVEAAQQAGLPVAHEVYADREYNPDGTLVSRRRPGAVIKDPDYIVTRAVAMVRDKRIPTVDGTYLSHEADTLCIHGDTPGAATLAARLRTGLEAAGIRVRPLFETLKPRPAAPEIS